MTAASKWSGEPSQSTQSLCDYARRGDSIAVPLPVRRMKARVRSSPQWIENVCESHPRSWLTRITSKPSGSPCGTRTNAPQTRLGRSRVFSRNLLW